MNQVAAAFEKSGNPYQDVLIALQHSGCPYVVIGGVAVVMHGSNRFTPDVNLLIDFTSNHFEAAIQAIISIGLHPENSTSSQQLQNPEVRSKLYAAGDTFYKFTDPQLPNFSVDLLLADIGDFAGFAAAAAQVPAFGTVISVLSLPDLLRLKQELNRMQDQVDVMQLELVQKILSLEEPLEAFERIQDELPPGFDEAFYRSLVNFQNLSPEERLDWLQNMLAAVGGFCMF